MTPKELTDVLQVDFAPEISKIDAVYREIKGLWYADHGGAALEFRRNGFSVRADPGFDGTWDIELRKLITQEPPRWVGCARKVRFIDGQCVVGVWSTVESC
jgi:hypothetical protein